MRALLIALLVTGCGASTTTARSTDLSGAIDVWARPRSDGAESRAMRRVDGAPAPRRSREANLYRRIEPRTPPRRHGRPVDVRFERAPLSYALQLLADTADLSIVIGEGLDREISVDLRRVDPVEAMRAIAEAHDVELSLVGRTVVARAR